MSTSAKTANSQKQSRYASDEACCRRRLSRPCRAIYCDIAGSPVCSRNNARTFSEKELTAGLKGLRYSP
jgi:hypothetical protein